MNAPLFDGYHIQKVKNEKNKDVFVITQHEFNDNTQIVKMFSNESEVIEFFREKCEKIMLHRIKKIQNDIDDDFAKFMWRYRDELNTKQYAPNN